MKTRLIQMALVAGFVFGQLGIAEPIPAVTETASVDIQSLRTALLPVVERTLEKVCGQDCPGFSVMPVFKTTRTSSSKSQLDDLGFDTAADSLTKQLSGVSIEVIASTKVKDDMLASIRNTVAAEAKNHTDLPVSVRTKTVASTEKLGAKNQVTSKDLLELARTGMWPLALLLLGVLALGAIAAFFHQKRKTAVHAYELQNQGRDLGPSPEEVSRREIVADAEDVVDGRLEDLSRLLEEAAYNQDFEALRKVVSLFPGNALSKQVQMVPVVPIMISKAMAEGKGQLVQSKQTVEWLKTQLDLVHWKRLREKVEPMAKLQALSPAQLSTVFSRVPTNSAKALILSFIESDNWPRLLSPLSSADKVEVGSHLFQIQQGMSHSQPESEKEVLESLGRVLGASASDKLLNDYVLYLSEEETRELSKNLTDHSSFVRPKSVEQVLTDLSDRQLLELVLGLDVEQIAILIDKLPADQQSRLLSALPKQLKERIQSRRVTEENEEQGSRWMETRSRLMKLYNESHSRSIH